jgi:hypothetical protein
MNKMVIAICVFALGLYVSMFVRLGELTFREHVARIIQTDEAKELGDGILVTVASAKTAVKTKISSRLEQTTQNDEGESEEEEPEEGTVRLGDITKPLPQR